MTFNLNQKTFSGKCEDCTVLCWKYVGFLKILWKSHGKNGYSFKLVWWKECGLIIQGMFEVYGKIFDLNIFQIFLKEWISEANIYNFSYSEREHENLWFCFYLWETS